MRSCDDGYPGCRHAEQTGSWLKGKCKTRFQPKGGMCAVCEKQNTNCNDLPFHEMLPVLDKYKDCTGPELVHVMIVKCSEFKRHTQL